MTPKERAEKICNEYFANILEPSVIADLGLQRLIAAQIEEAVLDDRMKRTADDLYKLSYQSGFKAACEKAKGIIQGWTIWTPGHVEKLVDRIGKMEPDDK